MSNSCFDSLRPLDGDRRSADHRIEEHAERLEESLVVQQHIDLRQIAGQSQTRLRQDRLPQRELWAFRSQQRGRSDLFCKGGWSHRCLLSPKSRALDYRKRAGQPLLSHFVFQVEVASAQWLDRPATRLHDGDQAS